MIGVRLGPYEITAELGEGCLHLFWSRDSRERFYRSGDGLMSVALDSTAPERLGARRRIADVSAYESQCCREFEVSVDDQRFLSIRAEPGSLPTRLDVNLDGFPELARKLTGK